MTPGMVSVVIPTYNYGRFVTEAVDSALAQTYPHREVIVVDDGSTDDTRQVLARYGDRVRYVFQTNQGLSAARNTGIRAAGGEFVALLDSDDVFHPRKLELQVKYLHDHPDIGLLGTGEFTDQRASWPEIETSGLTAERFTVYDLVGRAHFAPSSVLIRRSCLDDVGLFDPTLRCVEDRDMWIRFAGRHDVARLSPPLLWFRLHPGSLSTKALSMEEAEQRVFRKAFAEVHALRGRWLFRRKTYSLSALASAKLFGGNRQWGAAIRRVLWSFVLWPLPFRRADVDGRCERLRVLTVLVLRMLGLRAPDPGPGGAVAATAPRLQTAE
jgi:glycosyltransferase involved in cell wall biosynthesis